MTTVVNLRKEPYDIFIGRGSIYGNPFIIGRDGTREEVIKKYANWVISQPNILEHLEELRGKRLGCYCKPAPCHGDILVEILNLNEKEKK